MHETVMEIMVNVLGEGEGNTKVRGKVDIMIYKYITLNVMFCQEIVFPKMVASCCRFLCYFCRISPQNQGALFDHLGYLLEHSRVGLGNSQSLAYLWLYVGVECTVLNE